jgi:hypothetical protein
VKFDERSFITRVEAAGPRELADILERPSVDEEKALRAHLGDARYQRMHSMALKRSMTEKRSLSRGGTAPPKGNVVVIHGIMGAELSVSSGGDGDLTWVNAFRIMRGWLERLRLSDDGRADFSTKFKVRASGIMKRYYGELLLSLAERWNVQAFWFDWRKDLTLAADELNAQINRCYGDSAPVHIVAHSMGGLVARTFIKKYDGRWTKMWDEAGDGKLGGRLVMLGTPNHGSFAIPQVITGVEGLVRKLAMIDIRHRRQGLLEILNSFVGSYQMLPSPLILGKKVEDLYKSGSYPGLNVPQRHLDNALKHHDYLSDVVDPKRMIYVAGFDQPTFNGVKDWNKLDSLEGYEVTLDGDGRVPHQLGLLRCNGTPVPTYYIRTDHGNLSANAKILGALDGLLETGKTDDLHTDLAAARSVSRGAQRDVADARDQFLKIQAEDEAQMRISLGRMGTRGIDPDAVAYVSPEEQQSDETQKPGYLSPEERKVEETITRGFLAFRGEEGAGEEGIYEADESLEDARIEIGVVYGGIEKIDYDAVRSHVGNHPVDAVSVGHYIGVQPAVAELALDRAISAALMDNPPADIRNIPKADLLLTQYTERGIIHGRLGQPFFIPDPRASAVKGRKKTDRVIAIIGMDEPGRFGVPELTVLVRELCWSLGRLEKVHLATVLIGTGAGNIQVSDAVGGWISGIRRAITGSNYDAGRRLKRITFVEYDPRRIKPLQDLIEGERDRHLRESTGLNISFFGLSDKELAGLKEAELEWDRRDWERLKSRTSGRGSTNPTRVTLSLDAEKKIYRFGAISESASVPEREIAVDPALVWQANNELAGEQQPKMQLERGRFLEELLMPDDLRRQLYNRAPLVMMLDSTTARIHWEMVAQPDFAGLSSGAARRENAGGGRGAGGSSHFEYEDDFLGTSRGFTRQLRTTFAPPPEPPPPPRRVLRVLVVADPAPDAHLPGAQEEGVAVADLFESYNVIYKDNPDTRVEVVRLFGPLEATRTNVLRELMIRQYDVLHFAGHCVFRWGGDPSLSGWVFNAKKKELLAANELNRIDRIPKFVFSNACESGITPDRSQERSVDLAPSFAESFFARGVANFVCTAWPVDDLAARVFALTVYSGLLGIRLGETRQGLSDDEDASPKNRKSKEQKQTQKQSPQPMHQAMRAARLNIASTPNGRTTWGAYQHYGNPFFQLFYKRAEESREAGRYAQTAHGTKKSGPRAAAKKATVKKTAAKKKASKKS